MRMLRQLDSKTRMSMKVLKHTEFSFVIMDVYCIRLYILQKATGDSYSVAMTREIATL